MNAYETERLRLNNICIDNSKEIDQLMDDCDIIWNNYDVPHPYYKGYAKEWIEKSNSGSENSELLRWGIFEKRRNTIIGNIELRINRKHNRAEVGYWIGKEYRNNGYCEEALRKVIEIGFEVIKLNRIEAFSFSDNQTSNQLLEKVGFSLEGELRQESLMIGKYRNTKVYGFLSEEYH